MRDPSQFINDLTVGQARIIGNNDFGTFSLNSTTCELGTVKLIWKREIENDGVIFSLWLPRKFSTNKSLSQGPWCRSILTDPKLQLRPCYRLNINFENKEDDITICYFEGKAISEINKNIITIKAAIKFDQSYVLKIIKEDELLEEVPEYVDGELLSACFKGNIEKVSECLNRWEDVNLPDDDGDTPLHKAVMNGNQDIIKLLVERGAEPRKSNRYGQTPIDIAEKFFKKELVPVLRTYQ